MDRHRARSMVSSTTKRSRSNSNNSRSGSLESKVRSRSSILTLVGASKKGVDFKADKPKNLSYLIRCLEDTDYRLMSTMSSKELQCPSKARFLSIYSHFMQILCPNYDLPNRPEEIIPQELKILGYSHQVSKSSIQSIAPHSWPALLAALVFLCRSIECMQEIQPVYEHDDYLMDQCKIMTDGIETPVENLIEEVWKSLEPLKDDTALKQEKLQDVLSKVEEEKQLIQNTHKSLDNMSLEKKKLDVFITDMHQYLEVLNNENKRLESDIAALNSLSIEKKKQCEDLERLCAQQSISAEELEKKREEVAQLQARLDRLTEELERRQSSVHNKQLELARVKKEVKEEVELVNGMLTKLPNEENQVVQLEYGGAVPLEKQYVQHIRPLVNYWRNKLADPDQLEVRIEEYKTQMNEFTQMYCDKQAELKSAEKKLNELYASSTEEIKTANNKLQLCLDKFTKFETEYVRRKDNQKVELLTIKYEKEFLKEETERLKRMKDEADKILALKKKAEKMRNIQM